MDCFKACPVNIDATIENQQELESKEKSGQSPTVNPTISTDNRAMYQFFYWTAANISAVPVNTAVGDNEYWLTIADLSERHWK